jgi:hypothetical protein
MHSIAELPLGKKPPLRYYSEIAVKANDFADGVPNVPLISAWGAGITFGMFLNDNLPDCTCAAVGHGEQIHSARAGRPERATDAAIRDLFHRTGIEQHLGDNQGRYMEGVLRSLMVTGVRQDTADVDNPAGSYERIKGYAAVDWHNLSQLRAFAYIFGGLYAGLALPLSAYYQYRDGKPWTISRENSVPGSWGGHAVWISAVNNVGPIIVTWGIRKQASWAWFAKYCDELYAVVTSDWSQNPMSPSGFDSAGLLTVLASI